MNVAGASRQKQRPPVVLTIKNEPHKVEAVVVCLLWFRLAKWHMSAARSYLETGPASWSALSVKVPHETAPSEGNHPS